MLPKVITQGFFCGIPDSNFVSWSKESSSGPKEGRTRKIKPIRRCQTKRTLRFVSITLSKCTQLSFSKASLLLQFHASTSSFDSLSTYAPKNTSSPPEGFPLSRGRYSTGSEFPFKINCSTPLGVLREFSRFVPELMPIAIRSSFDCRLSHLTHETQTLYPPNRIPRKIRLEIVLQANESLRIFRGW